MDTVENNVMMNGSLISFKPSNDSKENLNVFLN